MRRLLLVVPLLAAAAAPPVLAMFDGLDGSLSDFVLGSVTYGTPAFDWNWREPFKALDGKKRAEVIRAAADLMRKTIETKAFAERYAERRASERPEEPSTKLKTPAELKAESLDQLKKQKAESTAIAAAMPKENRKEFLQNLDTMYANMSKEYAREELWIEQAKVVEAQVAEEAKTYKERLADWERDRPANLADLVRRRLKEVLDVTKDVKFDAKLVDRQFADEALEQKPEQWKLCYRIGKEACTAGREAAQAWLTAIRK